MAEKLAEKRLMEGKPAKELAGQSAMRKLIAGKLPGLKRARKRTLAGILMVGKLAGERLPPEM
ncbi:MAG: hypothetical protein ACPLRX_06470, partial [Candidatus Saccharicenans sp.]